jgi:hypothetical protein
MMRFLAFAAGLGLAASPVSAGPGEVTAVSVLPSPGHAEVVIDVAGPVGYQDFTLANPARLVIDVTGATLPRTTTAYDGVNRGGIRNVRYAQYQADVVRVVVELESLRDYTIDQRGDHPGRVRFGPHLRCLVVARAAGARGRRHRWHDGVAVRRAAAARAAAAVATAAHHGHLRLRLDRGRDGRPRGV